MFGFDPDMIFRIPALLAALTIHEYAHARMAAWLGDPTPRLMGRLTLNPIAHLDPIGLIMLWLFKFGWAKPVPVNPYYFRNGRKGVIMVSLAGPGANILLAFITALAFSILAKIQLLTVAWSTVLGLTYSYNIIFAIFNLLPLPPLDGSKVLTSILPGRYAYAFEKIEPYAVFILMGLIYLGFIGKITNPLQNILDNIIYRIVMLIL